MCNFFARCAHITHWTSTKNAWNVKEILWQNTYINEIKCEEQSSCQNSKHKSLTFFLQTWLQIHKLVWNNSLMRQTDLQTEIVILS